ncbi:ribonuclease H-like domain-containing protein [Pisolithus croceorrhizus]|nr:ribonuclease H-like domain-containing protein [Pisolithus croceorrhizus]KAI6169628.1 ribonuclease H-like domain-containing protein [Pisolithus thermaeus]
MSTASSSNPLPSSNWLKLKKAIQPSRSKKRQSSQQEDQKSVSSPSTSKVSIFPRSTSVTSLPHGTLEHVDLDTTEIKNGESIASLRRMVLGMKSYQPSEAVTGKYLALDCEMVGIGLEGSESSLARVSIVNFKGAVVLDAFVRQRERVVDYRTKWSGVRRADLGEEAKPFNEIQKTVADLIKDRILVGHAVHNDLKALLLSHPAPQLRDTQSLAFKHKLVKSRRPALRVLVRQELGLSIQEGEHDSVTDARATMALFRLHKKLWESGFRAANTSMKPKSKLSDGSMPSSVDFNDSRGRKRAREPTAFSTGSQSRSRSPFSTPSGAAQSLDIDSAMPKRKRPRTTDDNTGTRGRQGVSSGLSTVVRRAGGMKEVTGKGTKGKGKVVNGSKSKERWWATLSDGSSGSKGTLKLSMM